MDKATKMLLATDEFKKKLSELPDKVSEGDLRDHMLSHIQDLKFILSPPRIK